MDCGEAVADEAADAAALQRLQRSGIFNLGHHCTLRLRVTEGIGGGAETGGRVWSAALGLSAFLLSKGECKYESVLELGAGPGLPGLMLARIGAARSVCLTDAVPATIDNLEHNIAANDLRSAAAPAAAATDVSVAYLDWRDPVETIAARLPPSSRDDASSADAAASSGGRRFDLVLAADVVYEPTLAEPLLSTLVRLLRHEARPGCVALLSAEKRGGAAWPTFTALLQREAAATGLRVVDRSAEMQAATRAPSSPFYCPPASIERLALLEISAAPLDAVASRRSLRVVARLCASSGSSARVRVRVVTVSNT